MKMQVFINLLLNYFFMPGAAEIYTIVLITCLFSKNVKRNKELTNKNIKTILKIYFTLALILSVSHNLVCKIPVPFLSLQHKDKIAFLNFIMILIMFLTVGVIAKTTQGKFFSQPSPMGI